MFWNKEDPTHYEDKVHDFADTAIMFDHIFTTDADCLKRYKRDYGHTSIHLLMFATQPKLFNPIEKYVRTDDVVFAGSWYNNFKDRAEEMGKAFDLVINCGYNLKIYNRQSNSNDPNFNFPKKYRKYLHSSLQHEQLDEAHKGSNYALNFNTVKESPTIFARRVFELMCSNTLIITNNSDGVKRMFGDKAVYFENSKNLDLSHADDKKLACLYTVLRYHTYTSRFNKILDVVGLSYQTRPSEVLLVYRASTLMEAKKSIENFNLVNWSSKKAIIVLPDDIKPEDLNTIFIKLYSRRVHVTLEKDLNALVKSGGSYYIADVAPDMPANFIPDALLHYSYIDKNVAIVYDEKEVSPFAFENFSD